MEEPQPDPAAAHKFKIHFNFRDKSFTAALTMVQKADHDEYFIMPDDEALVKEFGGQNLNFFFNQTVPLKSAGPENDYVRSIMKGVQEFLDSKHS